MSIYFLYFLYISYNLFTNVTCPNLGFVSIYQEDLVLSISVMDDWIIVGQGAESTKTDYAKLGSNSNEECTEMLKSKGVYLSTCLLDFSCSYAISSLKAMTTESCSKLSKDVEHVAELFEPFVRLEESYNRGYGRSELGLYIVKSILESHQMTDEMKNTNTGVRFTILF